MVKSKKLSAGGYISILKKEYQPAVAGLRFLMYVLLLLAALGSKYRLFL
jgi:hypothetical protein